WPAGTALRPVRHAHPAGGVHEPLVALLSPVPAPSPGPQGTRIDHAATRTSGPRHPGWSSYTDPVVRALIFVRGRVQGVGFRWWPRARALELGLVGHARNLPDGRVEVNAQ